MIIDAYGFNHQIFDMTFTKKDRKILLVDDDADDRKYFIEALAEIEPSAECISAKDGREALDILHNEDLVLPDYIFLDLRMPRINGRVFLQEIKATDRLSKIPVIVYTTSQDVAEAEEMQLQGVVKFITKPTNTEEIYFIISQALEEQDHIL